MTEPLSLLLAYADSFLGVPYVWGGNSRHGMDCSGFMCEILRSVGLIGAFEDLSAQDLYFKFQRNQFTITSEMFHAPGDIYFYKGSSDRIVHVAMVRDKYRLIEAGGGDQNSVTEFGMVRHRSINYRRDLFAAISPPYPWA